METLWMRCSHSSLEKFYKALLQRSFEQETRRGFVLDNFPACTSWKLNEQDMDGGRVPMFSLGHLGLYFSEPQFPLCQASESRDSALALKPRHPEDGPRFVQLDSRLSSTKLCDWLVGERRDTKTNSGEKGCRSAKKSLLLRREEMDRLPCAKPWSKMFTWVSYSCGWGISPTRDPVDHVPSTLSLRMPFLLLLKFLKTCLGQSRKIKALGETKGNQSILFSRLKAHLESYS